MLFSQGEPRYRHWPQRNMLTCLMFRSDHLHGDVGAVANKNTQIWDIILIPVVQRRLVFRLFIFLFCYYFSSDFLPLCGSALQGSPPSFFTYFICHPTKRAISSLFVYNNSPDYNFPLTTTPSYPLARPIT